MPDLVCDLYHTLISYAPNACRAVARIHRITMLITAPINTILAPVMSPAAIRIKESIPSPPRNVKKGDGCPLAELIAHMPIPRTKRTSVAILKPETNGTGVPLRVR